MSIVQMSPRVPERVYLWLKHVAARTPLLKISTLAARYIIEGVSKEEGVDLGKDPPKIGRK